MALAERLQAVRDALDALASDALPLEDEIAERDQAIEFLKEGVRQREVTIAELRQALADCQDNEPTPEPEPEPEPEPDAVPTGTFYRGDDMTQPNDTAIPKVWGQYSGPGGENPAGWNSKIELRADGPTVNGLRQKYRRITCNNGDRDERSGDTDNERVEIGQVNNDDGFVFEVGGTYVTRQWMRVPTNLTWGTGGSGGGETGSLMQMKHSSQAAHGGFGGSPITPAPPLQLEQGKDGIHVEERAGNYSARTVWGEDVPDLEWWEIIYHVRYAFQGHMDIWFRYEGEAPAKVFSKDMSTIKPNKENKPMYSTYRVGVYQSNPAPARFIDVGPVRVERIG